jgi:hypothetical protein
MALGEDHVRQQALLLAVLNGWFLLTQQSRVLEKLKVTELIIEFLTFYGT